MMNRYFAELHLTEEAGPPPDVCTSVHITASVAAPNLIRATELVQEAIGADVLKSHRVLDFGVEEDGALPDDRAEGIIQGPDHENMVRMKDETMIGRCKKMVDRRTNG